MGTKMAPSYTNLFLAGFFEANALENAPFQPHTWLRYIDILWSGTEVWITLKIFIDYLNNIHSNLRSFAVWFSGVMVACVVGYRGFPAFLAGSTCLKTAQLHSTIKHWPNGDASWRKLKTWVNLRLRLARACVHLRWFAMTCVHFGRYQICTQVDASFSPFGHPTRPSQRKLSDVH